MTLKFFKSGIHTTMGLAAIIAVGAASGVFESDDRSVADQPKADTAEITVASTEKPQAKLQKTPLENTIYSASSLTDSVPVGNVSKPQNEKDQPNPVTSRPQFDVLRVEKDGSVVVAGNALPNSQVDIVKPDGSVIGQAQTGNQGDFALALEDILRPGNHVLGLRSTDADGVKLRSAQTGIVRIPEAEGDVLAMVSQDGEVSRILMKPTAFEPPDKSTSKREALLDVRPPAQTQPPRALEPLTPSKEKSSLQHPVLVEAVEVEGQHVFVAGAVMQGELVRVYLDNVAIGTARGTSDNRFFLSKKFDLKPGLHAVRVDVINEKTGGVWSRAEVGLQHELPEEVLAIRTNKNAEFASQIRGSQESVQVARLGNTSQSPGVTDEALAESPLNPPFLPQQATEQDARLKDATGRAPSEFLYAHAFQSAASDYSSEDDAPKYIRTGRAIIIKPGDSLWKISRRTYGDGMRYTTIFNANRNQIRDPNLIYAGQIFKIPEKMVE